MLNNQTWKELRYNYQNNILEWKLCEFNKECSACCSARSYYNNSKIKSIDPVCEFNKLMIVFLREELSKKGDIYFWWNSLNTTLSLRGDKFGKYN